LGLQVAVVKTGTRSHAAEVAISKAASPFITIVGISNSSDGANAVILVQAVNRHAPGLEKQLRRVCVEAGG
jgi:hypothetical protein